MQLPADIHAALTAHARFCRPEEACGLLATDAAGSLRFAYCLTNVEGSATRFTVDPVEHFHALQHAERHGWEITGAFHSHLAAAAYPSPTDVALAADPTWLYVIVGPVGAARTEVRGYRIRDGVVLEELLGTGPDRTA